MDWLKGLSTAELATFVTLIGAVFASLGVFCSKLFDIWVKYRRSKMEDRFDVQKIDLLEDKQLQDGLKFVVKKQDRRISLLETKCDNLQVQYARCMEEHARAETMCINLTAQVNQFVEERDYLKGRNQHYQRLLRQNHIDSDPSPIHEEKEDEQG